MARSTWPRGTAGGCIAIDKSGKSSLIWTADQPEIFAVVADTKGAIYAATSPDGKIYRIENGKATEYFAPQAKYIWSLVMAPDGTLYAGTGDQGKVFRVDAAGKGEVLYSTGQSHVTGLAIDRNGQVLAGTEPNGILYRISGKDKAFVLYDAGLPEIRAHFSRAGRHHLRSGHGWIAGEAYAGHTAKCTGTVRRTGSRCDRNLHQRDGRECASRARD